MSNSKILLIIDPQNDFHGGGSLAVPGADEDASRIANLLSCKGSSFDQVIVTLDSHYKIHVAHGEFWRNDAGESPPPFTQILLDDLEKGIWKPKNASLMEHCKKYCEALERGDKEALCIWPYHCLIGTPGHNVKASISDALHDWTSKCGKNVQYVMKGQNMLTEHYSALQADVPIEEDRATLLNETLMEKFQEASKIVVCGQAKSHCVNHTVRDMIHNLKHPSDASKIILLEDGMSPVAGFESVAENFSAFCKERGVLTSTCSEITV